MMTVAVGHPLKTVLTMATPRTAAEARATSKRLNAEARRDRERKEQAHQARQRKLDAMVRTASQARARSPRVNVAAIYAERNRPQAQGERKASPPRQARTLAQVAHDYYAPDASGDLIPAGQRGGNR